MSEYQESTCEIREERSLHSYRTEIPNIIEELELDPYEFRLYCHFKKVAGDNGSCTRCNKKIAKTTGMSVSQMKDKRKSLATKKHQLLNGKQLIKLEERIKENGEPDTTLIEITDIWPENFQILGSRFSGNRPRPPQNLPRPPHGHKEEPPKKNPLRNPPPPTSSKSEPPYQQEGGGGIWNCLKELGIQESEKIRLTRMCLDESRLERAVKRATTPGFHAQDLVGVIFSNYKNDAPEIVPKAEKKECNREIAKKLEVLIKPKIAHMNVVSIDALNSCLEFVSGMTVLTFDYEDLGFRGKVKAMLIERNLMTEEILQLFA